MNFTAEQLEENYKKFMNMTASAATYKAAFDQQIIEIAQQDSDISALQSSLKEKEKECEALKKSLLQYDESLINMTACAAGQYNQIEELKAENEKLKGLIP